MVASKLLRVFALCQSQLGKNEQNRPALNIKLLNNRSGEIMTLDLIHVLENSSSLPVWRNGEEYKKMDEEENHASAK